MPKPFLQPHHKQYIKDNYLTVSGYDMAKHLGCSSTVVGNYMRSNGLKMPVETCYALRAEKQKGRTIFTTEQDDFIKKNYMAMPVRQVAINLGASWQSVTTRLRQLGLCIPKEVKQKRLKDNLFKPGRPNPFKGVSAKEWVTKEQYKKFKELGFKNGHKPHNRVDVGTEVTYSHGYAMVCVAHGVFEFKHRLIWEQHNGKIPKGFKVAFKDGNKQNYNIANLRLLTNQEIMQNNSIANYPPELRKSIRLISKLKKQTDAN